MCDQYRFKGHHSSLRPLPYDREYGPEETSKLAKSYTVPIDEDRRYISSIPTLQVNTILNRWPQSRNTPKKILNIALPDIYKDQASILEIYAQVMGRDPKRIQDISRSNDAYKLIALLPYINVTTAGRRPE